MMLLDRALRTAFRNFSTLFLLSAVVAVTLHLVYGIVFRNVLEVAELHPYIAELKFGRQVNDVRARDLRAAATGRWILVAAQVALLPLLVAAARRIIVRDEHGEVPTVPDALVHPRDRRGPLSLRWGGREIATVAAGLALAAATWYLAQKIGLLAAEPLPDRLNFVTVELVRGLAVALGAPFLLAAAVTAGRAAAQSHERVRSST